MATPPTRGARGSGFGMRIHPIDGKYRMHYGEDGIGDGNYAPVTGTVVYAGWDSTGHGFGWCVGIREASNPNVIWWIAHFGTSQQIRPLLVNVGSLVTEGVTYLGPSGATGAAKGRHAHTERRVGGIARPGSGTATDPRKYYTSSAGGDQEDFPEEQEEAMATFVTAGTNTPWYVTDGIYKRALASGENQLLVDLGLVKWPDGAVGNVKIIGQAAIDRLIDAATTAGGFTSTDRDKLNDIANKQEVGQALTSAVALVNEHADGNRDQIIAAIPGSSGYDVNLSIDSVPGAATGTATPA